MRPIESPSPPEAAAMREAVHTVIVSQSDMMRYHDPVRIQGYCQSCEKYGQYWSCPPFDEPPLMQIPAWTHAVLVTQKTHVDPNSSQADLICQFLAARLVLADTMAAWESAGALAVIAGHCFGCTACTRARGLACCAPTRMRYSLEALGFDITGLAEGLAGQTVHWPKHGAPDYLLIVGALLCDSHDLALSLTSLGQHRNDDKRPIGR